MKDKLKITLVQANLIWENPKANKALFETMLKTVETDLIVLPEMFTTGFSMHPNTLAEQENGPSFKWMQNLAKEKNAAVAGSLIIREVDKYYNRLFFVYPDGNFKTYNKRHLFSLAGEENHYTAGTEQLIVEYLGWRIKPLICYDLRFPVWARNTNNYDLLLFVANWPAKRSFAWQSLLVARAIENQSYVAGLNRVGNDGNEIHHNGKSVVLNPLGETMLHFEEGEEGIKTVAVSAESLKSIRARFRFLEDGDRFEVVSEKPTANS